MDQNQMKMYVIVSNEAVLESKGNRGKMGAQIGHGFIDSFIDAQIRFPSAVAAYLASGVVAKVCLKADEETLHQLSRIYKDRCGIKLVRDAGLTVFPRPMITALGLGPLVVGPGDCDEREDILKNLRPWI